MKRRNWEGKHYACFSNTECEYFPCHPGADPERFNCLFCFCPLYALGRRCGGRFKYQPSGYKDCTDCLFPHRPENYGKILERYGEIAEHIAERDGTPSVPAERSGEEKKI